MNENLIPLTYEEALAVMVVEDERLLNDKESYAMCHYKWDGQAIVSGNNYEHDSFETLIEFPQLYRQGAVGIFGHRVDENEVIEKRKNKNLLLEAVKFAALKHGKDKRKGKNDPYIYHPLQTFQILKDNECSDTVLIAGLLHDTLEDTKTTPDEILDKFGQKILNIVKSESEDKTKTWKERKQTTIDNLDNATLEVKLVCCADKLANIREMNFDKNVEGEKLWKRFNADKEDIEWYYRGIAFKLDEISGYKMYKELLSLIDNVFVDNNKGD